VSSSILLASDLVTPVQQRLLVLGAVGMGAAAAWLVLVLVSIIGRDVQVATESWQFDAARRARIRTRSRIYRWFEPLIDELAAARLFQRLLPLEQVQAYLQMGAEPLPWKPAEYLATVSLKAGLVGMAVGVLLGRSSGPVTAIFWAGAAAFILFWKDFRALRRRAEARLESLKQRLPFTIDLLAIMMEAGAGFRESLSAVVNENRDHPVGVELNTVLQGILHGKTLRQTFIEFKDRIRDDQIDELVLNVTRGDELGTPLSRIFLNLADQMRLKRSQLSEKAAGKAQAAIVFPNLVVMLACLIAVLAPFMMNAINLYPF